MLDQNTVILRKPDQLFTNLDGGIVMMDVASGSYYTLDPIGADIWNQLRQPISIQQLCRNLEDSYAASADRIREDVDALLTRMIEKGLVQAQSAHAHPP